MKTKTYEVVIELTLPLRTTLLVDIDARLPTEYALQEAKDRVTAVLQDEHITVSQNNDVNGINAENVGLYYPSVTIKTHEGISLTWDVDIEGYDGCEQTKIIALRDVEAGEQYSAARFDAKAFQATPERFGADNTTFSSSSIPLSAFEKVVTA